MNENLFILAAFHWFSFIATVPPKDQRGAQGRVSPACGEHPTHARLLLLHSWFFANRHQLSTLHVFHYHFHIRTYFLTVLILVDIAPLILTLDPPALYLRKCAWSCKPLIVILPCLQNTFRQSGKTVRILS